MEGKLNKLTSKNTKTGETTAGVATDTQQIVEANAVNSPVNDILWNASQMDTTSKTTLEEDKGYGEAAIIRMFEFAANPEAFRQHTPTKQELFNTHYKGIEVMLWKDGLKVMPEVDPKVTINSKKTKYRIFVGAKAQRGQQILERPKTLSQIAHNL
jgi:hypothetical protein